MNEQLEKLLRELATKLGTTVEHLWGALVKQAYVNSMNDLGLLIFGGLLLGILFFVYVKYMKKNDLDEDIKIEFSVFTFIASIVYLISLFMLIPAIATGFVNPEYWALQQLLSLR